MKAAMLVLLCVALVPCVVADTSNEPDSGQITLELHVPKAFAFNSATVASPQGLSGDLRLSGIQADGSRTLLCEASTGWSASVDMRFYADAGTRALVVEGRTADGQLARVTVRLARDFQNLAGDETAVRLSALEFPSWRRGTGAEPVSILVPDATPAALATYAMSRLFVSSRNLAPLFVLALWSAVAALTPLVKRSAAATSGRSLAIVVLAALSISVIVGAMAMPHPRLYSIRVPAASDAASAAINDAGGAAAATPVRYDAVTTAGPGWSGVSWQSANAAPGAPHFVLVDAARTAGLPLSALDRYRHIRFRTAPTIRMSDSGAAMLAPAMLMAWGSDD